jgi:hypothetical protein
MRRRVITLFAAICLWQVGASAAAAQWRLYEETYIAVSPAGIIAPGYVFRTTSGNEYALDEVYFDLARYTGQRAFVIHDGRSYRLLVRGLGEALRCRKLTPPGILASLPIGQEVVISRIEREFTGYREGQVYELRNGQVWEQLSQEANQILRTAPEVYVIPRHRGHLLWVQGTQDFVEVRRVR